jgi:hypothetical protein
MNEPTFFKPHALSKAPIIREGRLIRDLTMEEQDWSHLDAPACERIDARSVCAANFREERMEAIQCALRMTG